MLASLKFVQGAVAKKDFLPAMTHFAIKNGMVRSYNGTIALCSPIPFDIDCHPKAIPLVKAISLCEETVSLSMTPAGRLSVRSGSFRTLIDCVTDETMHPEPEGEYIPFDGEVLLKAFKTLLPIVGDDASRPWSNGILLKEQSAFATCNVILAEYWCGSPFPHVVNIPLAAVKEIVRIGEAPIKAQMTDKSVTFHYEDGRWVRSNLLSTEWPNLERILNVPCNPTPVNEQLFAGLDVIKPFSDKMGRVFFAPGVMKTHMNEAEGAEFQIEGLDIPGAYSIEMLSLLKSVAKTADMSTYPSPCLFFGDNLRGAIVGMKV